MLDPGLTPPPALPCTAHPPAGHGEQVDVAESAALVIDGVRLHPQLLCALDAAGAPLAVSRMGVRELRAELAARRAPVAGNKKDLAKRLQKLRSPEDGQAGTRRVPRAITSRADWRGGATKVRPRRRAPCRLGGCWQQSGRQAAGCTHAALQPSWHATWWAVRAAPCLPAVAYCSSPHLLPPLPPAPHRTPTRCW